MHDLSNRTASPAAQAGPTPPAGGIPAATAPVLNAPVTWLTAAALAAAGLPGLPTSAFRVRERARRAGWTARRVWRRGGGWEYAVATMEPAIQLALARRAQQQGVLRLLACPGPGDQGAPPLDATTGPRRDAGGGALEVALMPAWARTRALARGEVLAHWREYRRHAGASDLATADFVSGYNTARIAVSDATRAALPRVSAASLKRWRQREGRGGLAALAGRFGLRRAWGQLEADPAMREVALAMLAEFGEQLRIPRVREALRATFPQRPTPSLGAIGRFIRGWRAAHPSLALAAHNPDRWKGSHRMKLADAGAAIARLNQEWQIDGTPGDILLLEAAAPDSTQSSKTRRFHILAIIDVYSRRALFQVAPAESASAAIRLMVRAVLRWGVPETIHGDNGPGFVSNHARRFLDDLGVNYVASPPFRPETKPFVESVIKTMSHQLLALLPGFTGHSVAERQALRARTSFAARFGAPARQIFSVRLTPADLQEKLDSWAEHLYGHRPHAGLAERSPHQVAAAWTGPVRHIANERALAIIAEEAVARRVSRDGVRIAGARFVPVAATLDAYVAHLGETALCFPDPAGDLGRYLLFIEGPRGREFIAEVENRERRGLDRAALALLARQAQDRFIREGRAGLRKLRRKIRPETLADTILEHARATAPSLADPLAAAGAGWQRYCELQNTSDQTVEDRAWMAAYEATREYRVARQFEQDPGARAAGEQPHE